MQRIKRHRKIYCEQESVSLYRFPPIKVWKGRICAVTNVMLVDVNEHIITWHEKVVAKTPNTLLFENQVNEAHVPKTGPNRIQFDVLLTQLSHSFALERPKRASSNDER